jgi:hypothetical protein
MLVKPPLMNAAAHAGALGGLISSTLLNLLVLPALTQRYVPVQSPCSVTKTR